MDDDQGVCCALASVLLSEGYQVTTVFDGRAAAQEFFGRNFDLVILDLNMPKRDGWMTLERLVDVQPLLPVVIITARPGQREAALRCGAAGFMEKPLELEALLALIVQLLQEPIASRLTRLQSRLGASAAGAANSLSWEPALGGALSGGLPPSATPGPHSAAA